MTDVSNSKMEGAVTADIIRSMNEIGEKIHEKIILPIHGLIVTRLFSKSIWELDRDGIDAIQRMLSDLGLITISEDDASSRNTELGTELNVDLLEVFLGIMFEPDAVDILEKYGFLDEGAARASLTIWRSRWRRRGGIRSCVRLCRRHISTFCPGGGVSLH